MVSLEEWDLSRNALKAIPSKPLGDMISLTSLHLYKNNLSSVPGHIANLAQLHTLTLHGNPRMTALSQDFAKLSWVKELSVVSIYINGKYTFTFYRFKKFTIDSDKTVSYLTDVTDRKAGNMTWYQVNPFAEMSTKEFPDEGLHQLLSLARSSRHPLLVFALAFLSEKGNYTIPFVNSNNVPPNPSKFCRKVGDRGWLT